MIVVQDSGSSFRREVGRPVGTDSSDEPELLLVDHAFHVLRQDSHPRPPAGASVSATAADAGSFTSPCQRAPMLGYMTCASKALVSRNLTRASMSSARSSSSDPRCDAS